MNGIISVNDFRKSWITWRTHWKRNKLITRSLSIGDRVTHQRFSTLLIAMLLRYLLEYLDIY
ncbi:hypothetical protein Cl131_gp144 [Aphanizomenon phage vB_AphaS-CL131]|nr:hypothetical protein Cl131_gp144 [Aphanizomenon phage vB_AphaS-CL131]